MWKVQLFNLNYDHQEEDAVAEVLKSRWITMGEKTASFEVLFGSYMDTKYTPTAVSSCTGALHLSLLALGIEKGDEVIIPGLTFIADANVVTMVGAKPVLADVSSLTDWNVSAESIEKKITNKTKAVIIVHFAGVPCDMDDIISLCETKKIALIEDVAHAPGATFKNVKCGNFGDLASFSFFTNKNISVGEGGMVFAKTETLNKRIKSLRSHGMTTLTLDRHKGRSTSYDVTKPGLNYRMDEMRAALGIVQLSKLDKANQNRKILTEYYHERLAELPITIPFQILANKTSAYHIYPILLPDNINREELIKWMKEKGIQTSIHYPSFQSFTAYKSLFKEGSVPLCEKICKKELTLPLYPTMTKAEVNFVVEALTNALNEQL
jgi:dTDP-4-amino-4,6-dideoxygalactose transaminase